jgi:hypothetical protein
MRPILILAALAVAAAAQTVPAPGVRAQSPTPDQTGPCRGPDGKFATAPACKGAGPAPAVNSVYRLDAKGRCRDDKGKMAKAEMCGVADDARARPGAQEKPKP